MVAQPVVKPSFDITWPTHSLIIFSPKSLVFTSASTIVFSCFVWSLSQDLWHLPFLLPFSGTVQPLLSGLPYSKPLLHFTVLVLCSYNIVSLLMLKTKKGRHQYTSIRDINFVLFHTWIFLAKPMIHDHENPFCGQQKGRRISLHQIIIRRCPKTI